MYDDEMEFYESEWDEFEDEFEDEDELEEEWEYESPSDAESPFSPEEEEELAAELLELEDEDELEQFLGSLVKGAARAVGGILKSPTGRAITSAVKRTAKKALPWIGRRAGRALGGAAGSYLGGRFGGSRGAAMGRRYGSRYGARAGSWLARKAGRYFGLELEGMSPEVAEFEIAKKIVRLAASAGKKAALTRSSSPVKKAKKALVAAARRHCPGAVKKLHSAPLRTKPFTVGRGRR